MDNHRFVAPFQFTLARKSWQSIFTIVIVRTTNRAMSWVFGSLMGSMWMGYVLCADLGGTSVFGSLNHVYPSLYALAPWFAAVAIALTAMTGLVAAYWTGSIGAAIWVAFFSALISGAITIVTVISVNVLFHEAMMKDPLNIQEFVRTMHRVPTRAELSDFIFVDALGGCAMQLCLAPLLGLVLGAFGALVGMVLRNFSLRIRSASAV